MSQINIRVGMKGFDPRTVLDRAAYKRLKAINKDEASTFIYNVYQNGFKDGQEFGKVNVDDMTPEIARVLKEELGIGATRFARIEEKIKFALLRLDEDQKQLMKGCDENAVV